MLAKRESLKTSTPQQPESGIATGLLEPDGAVSLMKINAEFQLLSW